MNVPPYIRSVPARCLIATLLLALALPASAMGQATRTWVSGVGNDSNPCSRTAPCQTFAEALTKTAGGGEIDVLDPGDFSNGSSTVLTAGPLVIDRSITISATGATAGLIALTFQDAIDVNAPGAIVTIRGLDINGQGAGLVGVNVVSAAMVRIENSSIYGFATAGVAFQPSAANTKLYVENSAVDDNGGDGILAAPQSGGAGTVLVTNDQIENNACGIVASSVGVQSGTPNFASNCGTNGSGGTGGSITVGAVNDSVSDNTGTGVLANGPSAAGTVANDSITGNGVGLQEANRGTITSFGGNELAGNATNGSPTSTSNQNTGPAGPQGPVGPQGPAGPRGPAGNAGQIELVTCKTVTKTKKVHGKKRKVKQQQCSAKLVSGTVKLPSADSTAQATVSRAGHVYARGIALHGREGTRLVLTADARLKSGRYTLTLRRGALVLGRESVLLA